VAVADEEHIRQLEQGADVWNTWLDSLPPDFRADLRDAYLSRTNLSRADLSDANLVGADLSDANLVGANLHDAILAGADLSGADLSGAILAGADLRDAYLSGANLSGANLHGADLSGANLHGADLTEASLPDADLSRANLSGANLHGAHLNLADLSGAHLTGTNLLGANLQGAHLNLADLSGAHPHFADLSRANLSGANLSGANLSGADLQFANLSGANLSGANLSDVLLFETLFVNVDLTRVIGLATCQHVGPSTIDYRTLQKSGSLPIAFLRGVGLPDIFIEYLPSLTNQAIQLYSCFISYSAKDDDFAKRIHADLQNSGVRCWFSPHDMPIGGKLLDEIDAAIRLRDKVLLILSDHSINSDWVEDEVTKAFEEERKRGQLVLFPIRLDDAVMETNEAWAAKLRARLIGDFRGWKDHDVYKRSLDRVVRDLTISPKVP
jgi:uncharacterized protein YjbI with pentapeptide repeats